MKEEQWKVAHVTYDGRLVHNPVLKMQMMSEALKRVYDWCLCIIEFTYGGMRSEENNQHAYYGHKYGYYTGGKFNVKKSN